MEDGIAVLSNVNLKSHIRVQFIDETGNEEEGVGVGVFKGKITKLIKFNH